MRLRRRTRARARPRFLLLSRLLCSLSSFPLLLCSFFTSTSSMQKLEERGLLARVAPSRSKEKDRAACFLVYFLIAGSSSSAAAAVLHSPPMCSGRAIKTTNDNAVSGAGVLPHSSRCSPSKARSPHASLLFFLPVRTRPIKVRSQFRPRVASENALSRAARI